MGGVPDEDTYTDTRVRNVLLEPCVVGARSKPNHMRIKIVCHQQTSPSWRRHMTYVLSTPPLFCFVFDNLFKPVAFETSLIAANLPHDLS
jgi:hypothetical protein